jgi:hypothetical protein
MDTRRPGHVAYLLRLWRADDGRQEPIWRASLQDVRTGERRGFAGLAEAVRYLEQQMEGPERGLGNGEPSADAERR